MSLAAAEQGLVDVIKEHTGFQTGYADLPALAQDEILESPFYILNPIPGGLSKGSMARDYEILSPLMQIATIGVEPGQARQAHDRLHEVLQTYWAEVPGLMGPPSVNIGGIVRTDERHYTITDTVYVEVTLQ